MDTVDDNMKRLGLTTSKRGKCTLISNAICNAQGFLISSGFAYGCHIGSPADIKSQRSFYLSLPCSEVGLGRRAGRRTF